MKLIRITFIIAFTLCGLAFTEQSQAASTQIQATMVLANHDGQGVDSQLSQYANNLKKVFRQDTFKYKGRSSTKVDLPGSSSINFSGGHKLKIDATETADGRIRLNAKWIQGSKNLINTTLVVTKNRPAILGGPSTADGNLILIVVAR